MIKRIFPTTPSTRSAARSGEDDLKDSGDNLNFEDVLQNAKAKSRMTLTTDEVTRARFQAYVLQLARERNISTAEATIRMLTGHRSVLDPTPPPVVHVFTPKGRLPGDPVYMPTSGWTGPEGTAAFDDWLAQCDPPRLSLRGSLTRAAGGPRRTGRGTAIPRSPLPRRRTRGLQPFPRGTSPRRSAPDQTVTQACVPTFSAANIRIPIPEKRQSGVLAVGLIRRNPGSLLGKPG